MKLNLNFQTAPGDVNLMVHALISSSVLWALGAARQDAGLLAQQLRSPSPLKIHSSDRTHSRTISQSSNRSGPPVSYFFFFTKKSVLDFNRFFHRMFRVSWKCLTQLCTVKLSNLFLIYQTNDIMPFSSDSVNISWKSSSDVLHFTQLVRLTTRSSRAKLPRSAERRKTCPMRTRSCEMCETLWELKPLAFNNLCFYKLTIRPELMSVTLETPLTKTSQ